MSHTIFRSIGASRTSDWAASTVTRACAQVIAVACSADGGAQQSGCVRGSSCGGHSRPLIAHRVHTDAECRFQGKRMREAGCARLCARPGTWGRLGAIRAVAGLAAFHALLVTLRRGVMVAMRQLRRGGRHIGRKRSGHVCDRLHGKHEANPKNQPFRHHASTHNVLSSSAKDTPLWLQDCSGFRLRVKR